MKVHFLTSCSRDVASARFRAWWIAEAWHSSDVTVGPPSDPAVLNADVVVIIATVAQPLRRLDLPKDPVLVWDLTDPIWCYMGDAAFRESTRHVAHITVSSAGLQSELPTLAPTTRVTLIPDRLPYEATSRVHEDVAVPTLIWFGYGYNRWPAFSGVAPLLLRLRRNGVPFKLQIVDDQSHLPLYGNDRYGLEAITEYLPWALDTMHARLCAADVALLPPFPGYAGMVKSHNRVITAAWAGLPTAYGGEYGRLHDCLTDWKFRRDEGRWSREQAEQHWDVRQSVVEWQELLARVITTRSEVTR